VNQNEIIFVMQREDHELFLSTKWQSFSLRNYKEEKVAMNCVVTA